MVNEFINEICYILNIDYPKVIVDNSKFHSKAQLAMTQISKSGEPVIYVSNQATTQDILFEIARELRYIWQLETGDALYALAEKDFLIETKMEVFKQQLAEIDADAFASLVINRRFDEDYLAVGFSKEYKQLVDRRAQEIMQTYS